MQTLTNPILQDCARIIDRHPDLPPQYKVRLLEGLARVDQQLAEPARVVLVPDVAAPAAKGRR